MSAASRGNSYSKPPGSFVRRLFGPGTLLSRSFNFKTCLLKALFLMFVSWIIATATYCQDLSDIKYFPKLKGVKSFVYNAKEQEYSCLLSSGTFLKIEYNVVTDGEYNGTYTFLKQLDDWSGKPDASGLLQSNLREYIGVLPFSTLDHQKIIKAVNAARKGLHKKSLTIDLSLAGYDENMLMVDFLEELHLFRCTFFFRRLL
jgi:hypothetical protein